VLRAEISNCRRVTQALFTIGPDAAGELLLTWLAIRYHDVYR
jgi:hypothetical protein